MKGRIQEVMLPDSAYGEWIIYENKEAKYHIDLFNKESKSVVILIGINGEKQDKYC